MERASVIAVPGAVLCAEHWCPGSTMTESAMSREKDNPQCNVFITKCKGT